MNISFEIIPFIEKKNKISIFSLQKFFFGLKKLLIFNPRFISVTFSNRFDFKQTLKFCFFIKKCGIKSIPHFSCNLSTINIIKYSNILFNNKIFELFPLRGNSSNFKYSTSLIDFLKKTKKFNFFSSGYPEGHPEEKNFKQNINILKKKCYRTIGIFTQFFIGFDIYYFFLKKIIEKRFLPRIYIGIMNIKNFKYLKKYSKICKFSIPIFFKKIIKSKKDYIEYIKFFINSIRNFYKPYCLHIYTMNNFNCSKRLLKIIT